MRCPSCGHDNRAERRFCAECGAVLAAVCASCGVTNQAGEKFCGGCRARLPGEARASAVAPPAHEAEAALLAGERRQLTVLFCDLVGSTALAQQLDAEEWRDLIAQYQHAAAGAVAPFGGHVAQFLGDGLLIYFGWPTAREDDPERAVRAGLAILDAVVRLSGRRLAVRIGVHTGPVVIGEMGQGETSEVLALGDTTNIAARVQGAAEPDTAVITATTQRLVGGLFVVEDRGPQMLKGVREPVTLYRVVQPSGVRSRLDVAAGRLTRFVGRDIELATLVDHWKRAADGYLGVGGFLRGRARVESGQGEAGIAEMQQGMTELARIGNGLGAPQFLGLLAEGLRAVGRHDEALGALGLGVAQAEGQGQHYYDAELHRLRAEIRLDTNSTANEAAEALFGQALEIARRQEARTFELRAATGLAQLWQRQGKRDAAHALLGPLYGWFTEGFDTKDLKDARALLAVR